MTVLLGHSGRVLLSRAGTFSFSTNVSSADVNTGLRRVGIEGAIDNLLTGDRIEIKTTDSRGIAFFPAARWPTAAVPQPSISAYVNVNEAGGLRFFSNFTDAVNNNRAAEYVVQTFGGGSLPVSVSVQDINYNILGNVSGYEFNTEREDVDITTLNDKFRQRYSAGLISGNGQITTYFNFATTGIQETPLLLTQTIQRLEAGSKLNLRLYVKEDPVVPSNNVYYEVEAMVVRSGINVTADTVIEATIDFVSTGEVRLLVGAATTNTIDTIILEQTLGYLLTQPTD